MNSVTRARVRKRRDLIFSESEEGFWVDLTQALTEKLSRTGQSTMTKTKSDIFNEKICISHFT
jgi:hypothetical protein